MDEMYAVLHRSANLTLRFVTFASTLERLVFNLVNLNLIALASRVVELMNNG